MTIENIPLSSVSDEHFAGQEKSWKGQRGGENERSYRVKDHKQSLKGKDARVLRKGGAEKMTYTIALLLALRDSHVFKRRRPLACSHLGRGRGGARLTGSRAGPIVRWTPPL